MAESKTKYVKLPKTVIVTVEGRTYPISSSHPLYEKILHAIDTGRLDQLSDIVEHNDREDFLNKLRLKPR